MPILKINATNVEAERGQIRQSQLQEIMKDAVESVLDRHDTRRGPFVIEDSDLRSSSISASR